MNTRNIKLFTFAAIALMTVGTAGLASSAQYNKPMSDSCVSDQKECPVQGTQNSTQLQGHSGKRHIQKEQNKIEGQLTNGQAYQTVVQAHSKWKFDPNNFEHRRHKDSHFRFEYGGYWYPEPYWLGYGLSMNYGVSCGGGRNIMADHGFRRVRTIECHGRTFTYLGRRHGHTYRVLVSSRSGQIVSVRPV